MRGLPDVIVFKELEDRNDAALPVSLQEIISAIDKKLDYGQGKMQSVPDPLIGLAVDES
jgi:hypothetical protein